ncbi:MAG: phage portal protein, partial [Candidatus Hodarchaeales archaeon]
MGIVSSFVKRTAMNLDIDIFVEKRFSGNGDDLDITDIEKSSIWPLAHRLINHLDVAPLEADLQSFAQIYAAIVWVYVAAWTISSSIGSLPFQLCKGKKDNPDIIDSGEAFDLFEYPNEWESGQELIEDLALFMELTGNGYWEKYGVVGGLPTKLFNLEPYFVKIKPHPTLKVDKYVYDIGEPGGKK